MREDGVAGGGCSSAQPFSNQADANAGSGIVIDDFLQQQTKILKDAIATCALLILVCVAHDHQLELTRI